MLIEVRKAGFVNKGAELMLHAVLQQLRGKYPEARYAMAPTTNQGNAPYLRRSQQGLYQKAWYWRRGVQLGDLAQLAPARLRDMFGVVLDREIDVVLDVAGFAYSDQWGTDTTVELERASKRWKRQGTTVVLMPQAFGPFSSQVARDALKRSADFIDLICARDPFSYQHLIEVCGERSNIVRFPDFTNLVAGIAPAEDSAAHDGFCLVPNQRMIDKVPGGDASTYIDFLARCSTIAKALGERPFLLVHEGRHDAKLAEAISSAAGGLPILQEHDPLKIKGILGVSRATIGSRFHGLVSALSQGVPSLGTGWSHKYKALFDDYGCPEALLTLDTDPTVLNERIEALFEKESRRALQAKLEDNSQRLKAETARLWESVFGLIDNRKR